jgi:CHAT domain-containing protein/tetratricopeptide (TPR) repeat protein
MKKIIISLVLLPILTVSFGQDTKRALLLLQKADSLFEAAEYVKSEKLFSLADSLFNKIELKNSIYCKCKISECLSRQGKLDESQQIVDEAIKECGEKYSMERAEAVSTLGYLNLLKGRQDLAEENFSRSLSFYSNQGPSLAKAQCYNNIGLLNFLNGNFEKASEYMFQALEMRKELTGVTSAAVAASYNNLGLLYSNEQPEKALEQYNKALAIYSKIYPLNHPSIGVALNNIGIIERKMGDTETSLSTFEKALNIWNNLYGKNHPNVAFVYANIGESFLQDNNPTKALEFQQKALEIYLSNYKDKHPEVASTYNAIGNIYSSLKKRKLALENYQKAIVSNAHDFNDYTIYQNPKVESYYKPDLLLISLLLKAKELEKYHYEKSLKLSDLQFALSTLQACDTLLGKLRQIRTDNADKIELGRLGSEIYEDAVSISVALSEITLKKQYYLNEAFYFSEKNKGAVLLESIADAEAKSFAGIPDSVLLKEKNFKNGITLLEQKLAQGPSPQEEKEFRKQLFHLKTQYEGYTKMIETSYPDYYSLKYNSKIITVKDLQTVLLDKEAMLSYFTSEERGRIFIFYVSKKSFKVINLPLSENFNKEITSLRNSLRLKIDQAYIKNAFELYHSLIPSSIPGKTTQLVIIPDGRLGSIPFEILLSKKPKEENKDYSSYSYLIKNYSIIYNYSSLLFYNSRKDVLHQENKLTHPQQVLLCAPIDFTNCDECPSLAGTKTEVEMIQQLCSKNDYATTVLLNKEANEKNIKSSTITNYSILHFATHGIVNEEKPELSQLFLNGTNDGEDGNLYSGEIYNLKLDAKLVVLSACQTGLGKITKGEGIIGLSRALIYAGAKNVLVSLWTVSDSSTPELMTQFYFFNFSNHSDAESLRMSKLKLIQDKKFAHPYYWGPFIYIGQ